MKIRSSTRYQTLTWLVLCLCFSLYYVLKTHVGGNSSIAAHALMTIEPPFVFRLLMPWALHQVLPIEYLDLSSTRTVIAWVFSLGSVLLMPSFMSRVLDRPLNAQEAHRARLAGFAILIAHYVLPRNLKFYYVYDLPAITFYQLAFLTLTCQRVQGRWLGVALTAIFAFNRETIGIAVIHAATWHGIKLVQANQRGFRTWLDVASPLMLSVVAVLTVRSVVSYALNHPTEASFSWMDGEQLRLVANLQRMATKHHHAISLLWFGAGALIWLPKRWSSFPPPVKALFVASLPVFAFFCIVGNFVELRMFSELIPVLAVGLALPRLASATSAKPAT